MADDTVDLDARRSPEGRLAAQLRREDRRGNRSDGPAGDRSLRAQLRAGPSDHRDEAAARAIFLLQRLARTPAGRDAQIRNLIRRALGDFARLAKREERKR